MPTKPTGRIGPFRLTGAPDGPTATVINATKNPENDFDFTLELPGGNISLDLTEIIYSDAEGRPYEGENMRIESYKYAEQIRDAVMAKSTHYGRGGTQPIHLLTYITHWRFQAHEVVIRLVQHMLQQSRPIMENVFFLTPLDNKSAVLRVLYPSANPLEGHDLNSF